VAVTRVERGSRFEAVRSPEHSARLAWCGGDNLAQRTDRSSDARVGGSEQPASILDCPHARHVQVLSRSARLAEPAVVGDIHEQLGSVSHKSQYLIRKDRFVADEGPDSMSVDM